MNEHQFEEAVARMVRGDKSGLKEIYENYIGYIYRIIYDVLQNKENAEDVTSEFFIRLWDKAEQFKPGSGHKGYLATMARNMAIDFLRKHRREELTALMQDLGGAGGRRARTQSALSERGRKYGGAGGRFGFVHPAGIGNPETIGAAGGKPEGTWGAYL